MRKQDCKYYEEVISNGEKVGACRVSGTAVNTYFFCDACGRYEKKENKIGKYYKRK